MSPPRLMPAADRGAYGPSVEWEDRLAHLPETYAEALRLRSRGLPDAEIAARLDVPVESLGTLIGLAEAKLARLQDGGMYEPEGS